MRKRIFYFDFCRCSVWTLNWILCKEPIFKRCRYRFRVNVSEPLRELDACSISYCEHYFHLMQLLEA